MRIPIMIIREPVDSLDLNAVSADAFYARIKSMPALFFLNVLSVLSDSKKKGKKRTLKKRDRGEEQIPSIDRKRKGIYKRVVKKKGEIEGTRGELDKPLEGEMPEEMGEIEIIDNYSEEEYCCSDCGSMVPPDSEKCPKCGISYIGRDMGESIDRSIDEEATEKKITGCAHLDVTNGTLSYAGKCKDSLAAENWCDTCKTSLELETKECPRCGRDTENELEAAKNIFTNMEIGNELLEKMDSELTCPICGELKHLKKGLCEGCGTQLITAEHLPEYKSNLLIPLESMIYFHLDVEFGKVSYFQRIADNEDQVSFVQKMKEIASCDENNDLKGSGER